MRTTACRLAILLVCAACAAPGLSPQEPARQVTLGYPIGIAALPDGSYLVSERRNHRIMRLDPVTATMSPFAGTGEAGFGGDGGAASTAQLNCPDAIDTDQRGNVYVADRCNERIRRIDAFSGLITTVAGSGQRGPAADGPALEVDLTGVFYLRVHDEHTILFTDTDANMVRELDLARQRITTLAGNGIAGFSGDGDAAVRARLNRPHTVLRLQNGDLVIGDSFNHRLRQVDASTGVIRTIAGTGEESAAETGVSPLNSGLLYFGEVQELDNGDLIWTEWGSSQLMQLDRSAGVLIRLAGSDAFGRVDPDGPLADRPAIGSSVDFLIDAQGRYVIAVASAGLVRRVDLQAQTVETLAGVIQR